jgi:hypothetical protein
MKVRPGADDHGIDVRVGNEILPVVKRFRDAVLSSNGSRRLGPAIADRDDFDVSNRPKSRYVPGLRVGAGADQTNAERGIHDVQATQLRHRFPRIRNKPKGDQYNDYRW